MTTDIATKLTGVLVVFAGAAVYIAGTVTADGLAGRDARGFGGFLCIVGLLLVVASFVQGVRGGPKP